VLVPTIQIVYASPLSIIYLSGGVYPRGTYTIWREGSNFYAKDSYGKLPSWSENTNARAVIQNASDALVNGGSIFLVNGEYPIEIINDGTYAYGIALKNDDLSLICEENAWLKVPDNSLATSPNYGVVNLAYNQTHYKNFYVKVNIDGNKVNQVNDQVLISVCRTNGTTIIEGCNIKDASDYGIYGVTSEEIIIRNNRITNCDQAGVHIENTISITLDGNSVTYCATGYFVTGTEVNPLISLLVTNNVGSYSFDEHGIYISDWCESIRVFGNIFSNNYYTGIRAGNQGHEYVTIDSNICNENGIGGIWYECGAGPIYAEQVTISNNVCSNNTGIGIQAHKVNRLSISDNIVANNTNRGINWSEAKYQNIHGNTATFNNIGICDVGQGTQVGAKITNNHCVNNTSYDLILEDSVDYAFISLNYLGKMYLNHSTATCDYNYVFGNYIQDLSQSAGSPSGNNYTHNYPDNTP